MWVGCRCVQFQMIGQNRQAATRLVARRARLNSCVVACLPALCSVHNKITVNGEQLIVFGVWNAAVLYSTGRCSTVLAGMLRVYTLCVQ